MIEVQIIQSTQDLFHISILTDREESNSKPYLNTINISELRQSIDEVNVHIPNSFLRSGANIHLLERLKQEGFVLFQHIFGDYSARILEYKSVLNPIEIQLFVDEACGYFPFEVLFDGEHFLSDGFIISRVILNKDNPNSNKKCSTNNRVTFVGDPSEDRNIESSVQNEIYSISETLPEDLVDGPYLGKSVRKISLTRSLSHTSVFHYSGHYDKGKGWRLADNEYFTNSDIHQLAHVPQLVIDNSCGEPSIQWVQSFLNEGIKTVIATSGNIPSDYACEFGIQLYKHLSTGSSCGVAFFLARRHMIEKKGLSDLSWIFYNLYGDSKINPIKFEHKKISQFRLKKWGIKVALGTLLLFLVLVLTQWYQNRFHTEFVSINVHKDQQDIEMFKDGNKLGILPMEHIQVKNGQNIVLKKSGYHPLELSLNYEDSIWVLRQLEQTHSIVENDTFYQAVSNIGDSYLIRLADTSFHKLQLHFTNPNIDSQKENLSHVIPTKIHFQGQKFETEYIDTNTIFIDENNYFIHAFVLDEKFSGSEKYFSCDKDTIVDISNWEKFK